MGAARHQIIACAFGCRLGQDRGFNLHEALAIEMLAQKVIDLRPQRDAFEHMRTAQIHVAITEPDIFSHLMMFFIQRKGRCLRLIEQFDLSGNDLDLTGRQIRVNRAFRSVTYLAADPQHIFTANPFGLHKALRTGRIKNQLDQAATITQIDKDNPAVVPAPVYPATDLDLLIH